MVSVKQIDRFLEQWQVDAKDLHRRLILAPTPRERALRQAQEMARHLAAGPRLWQLRVRRKPWDEILTPLDPFDELRRSAAFGEGGPAALIFEQSVGSTPPLMRRSRWS